VSDILTELAQRRRALQLSQATIAERMGVPQSVVSRLEHSRNARLDTIRSYAQALGFDVIAVPNRMVSRVRAMLDGGPNASDQAPPLIRPRPSGAPTGGEHDA
jgi:transcriptional regulator with XRE-family HTH domain